MVLKLGRELGANRTLRYFTPLLGVLLALSAVREQPTDAALLAPPKRGVYHGAFPDFGPTESRVTTARVLAFERLAGKQIALASFSDNWFRGIRFPRAAALAIRRTGAIPVIRMMPRSTWRENRADRRYTLARVVRGDFDRELRRWAQEARALSEPLVVDFAPEMNGSWFPWSGRWNGGAARAYGDRRLADGPERYRDAFRHVVDLFRSESVDNVCWIFHVNARSDPLESWNSIGAYYPGDSYVDWIGVSAYGAQTVHERASAFASVLDPAYRQLAALSPGKPLMVSEFGVADRGSTRSKAIWIERALAAVAAGRYPRVKAISYWHSTWREADGSMSELRIDSSPASLAAYRRQIAAPVFVPRPRLAR